MHWLLTRLVLYLLRILSRRRLVGLFLNLVVIICRRHANINNGPRFVIDVIQIFWVLQSNFYHLVIILCHQIKFFLLLKDGIIWHLLIHKVRSCVLQVLIASDIRIFAVLQNLPHDF